MAHQLPAITTSDLLRVPAALMDPVSPSSASESVSTTSTAFHSPEQQFLPSASSTPPLKLIDQEPPKLGPIFSDDVKGRYLKGCIPLNTEAAEAKFSINTEAKVILQADEEHDLGPSITAILFRAPGGKDNLKGFEVKDVAGFDEIPVQKMSDAQNFDGQQFFFLSIPSNYSWGSLLIDAPLLRKIVQNCGRSVHFLSILSLYGKKIKQINEDYPVFKIDPHTTEINYNLTHLVVVYKKKGDDPAGARTKTWCLRKMGISARNRSFVFIQPSDAFASKLKLSWSGGSDLYSAAKVHLMAVEAANEDWTDYLNELEEKLIEIKLDTESWGDDTNRFEHGKITDVQRFKDELLVVIQAVRINRENLDALIDALDRSFTPEERTWVKHMSRELRQVDARGTMFVQRASCIIESLPSMFSRQEYAHMAENAVQMTEMSKQAAENARSVKVITVVTMCFLPMSLMASVFSMMVFRARPDDGKMLVSKGNLVAFLGATMGLVLLTFGVWWLTERRSRMKSKERKRDEEKGQ